MEYVQLRDVVTYTRLGMAHLESLLVHVIPFWGQSQAMQSVCILCLVLTTYTV